MYQLSTLIHLHFFVFAFACNVKTLQLALFFSLSFSPQQIWKTRRVWLNLDTLKKYYLRNTDTSLKFRV